MITQTSIHDSWVHLFRVLQNLGFEEYVDVDNNAWWRKSTSNNYVVTASCWMVRNTSSILTGIQVWVHPSDDPMSVVDRMSAATEEYVDEEMAFEIENGIAEFVMNLEIHGPASYESESDAESEEF